MPTYPGNFLQDHFSFTLMFLIPVFWLMNWLTGTYTLIIIQYFLIIVAAWFSYKLITMKSDNIWLGAGVLVYYFLLLGRYTTFSCDVNLAVISSCFIPIFIYYFEKKKYLIALALFILSLLSRENIPLWFIFIFIVLFIQHRKDKKAVIFSIIGIFISVVYFILLFKVFIPAIETGDKQFTLFNYSALGANPGEALKFVILNPIETVKLFFINHLNDPAYKGVKGEFYIVYLVSGGIILLLRPRYLIWFIPIIAQKVLNDSYIRWGISTYYSIEVVSLLPLSVFLILASLKSKTIQLILAISVCLATLCMTLYKLNPDNVEIRWTMNPAKERIYKKEFFKAPFNIRKVNQILKQIPKDARVSASDHLFSHLSQRQSIYLFPKVEDAEFIVFSVFDNYFMFSQMENEEKRNEYLYSADWQIIAKEFPVFLLKKKGVKYLRTTKVYDISFKTDTILCNYEVTDSVNKRVMFDDGTVAEASDRISSTSSRSGHFSLLLNAQNPYGSAVKFVHTENPEYIKAIVWVQCTGNHANIVASCENDFYLLNGSPGGEAINNWKKLELSFWVPRNLDMSKLAIYLWNTGSEPMFFDDFQIIKYSVTN
jgi:uncharacterized membrane protein